MDQDTAPPATPAADDERFVPSHEDYTADELLEQAQGNAQAAVIATVAFLRARGIPVSDWAEAIGGRFSRAWGDPEPWDADEFLDGMLTNLRSLGASVDATEFGADRSTATLTGFPDRDQCDLFGVAPADAAVFLDATTVIAAERGLAWAWALTDDELRLTVDRQDAAAGQTTKDVSP